MTPRQRTFAALSLAAVILATQALAGWLPMFGTPRAGGGSVGSYRYAATVTFPENRLLANPAIAGIARDPQRSDTLVRWFDCVTLASGTGLGCVSVPASSHPYRFVIYSPVPVTGAYQLNLENFR